MAERNYEKIGADILYDSRNRLYLSLPYLDSALCALRFEPGADVTLTVATDGETLRYNGSFLAERYLRGSETVNRLYLHVILHCLLRHLAKKHGRNSELWDLACDAAVESILDSMNYPCLRAPLTPARQKFYGECLADMKVLTAEGIYRKLQRDRRPPYEIAQLQRLFLQDDHGFWDPEERQQKERSERQDESWKGISEKTETAAETVLAENGTGGEAVLEQIRVENRNTADYRKFLRRFAAPREIMQSDDDAFDYIYYTYGLNRYGNMPLIEPPETREEKRIEDLIIAIDTSMSTSGELVRAFLKCTYSILRSTDTFTRRLNIHIMQCDDELRSDDRIGSMEELRRYMENVNLTGGSATDFRPVFARAEELRQSGAFTNLRGLIYFTDGMGIYPSKRPDYEAAFVLLEEPPLNFKMPAWCTRVLLDEPALERAEKELPEPDEPAEEMPEL